MASNYNVRYSKSVVDITRWMHREAVHLREMNLCHSADVTDWAARLVASIPTPNHSGEDDFLGLCDALCDAVIVLDDAAQDALKDHRDAHAGRLYMIADALARCEFLYIAANDAPHGWPASEPQSA